jgi:hypothetical protein
MLTVIGALYANSLWRILTSNFPIGRTISSLSKLEIVLQLYFTRGSGFTTSGAN